MSVRNAAAVLLLFFVSLILTQFRTGQKDPKDPKKAKAKKKTHANSNFIIFIVGYDKSTQIQLGAPDFIPENGTSSDSSTSSCKSMER